MTALLVIMTVLLIVIVIWMIVISMLYYSLYKGFVALKGLVEISGTDQIETVKMVNESFDNFVELFKAMEDQALDCVELSKKFAEDAEKNKEFAMQTIRATRSMQNAMAAAKEAQEQMKEKKFVFEEPEEDPNEPRS